MSIHPHSQLEGPTNPEGSNFIATAPMDCDEPGGSSTDQEPSVIAVGESPSPTYQAFDGSHSPADLSQAVERAKAAYQKAYAFLGSVQSRVQSLLDIRHIQPDDYKYSISTLQSSREIIEELGKELKSYIAQPTELDKVSFTEKFITPLKEAHDLTCEIAQSQGFRSIEGGLSHIIGTNWRNLISEETCQSLSLMEKIFTPTGYTHYQVLDFTDKGRLILEDSEGIQHTIERPELAKGCSAVEMLHSFEAESFFEELHGGEFMIPLLNEEGNIEKILSMKGSFTNDPLNITYTATSLQPKKQAYEKAASAIPGIAYTFKERFLAQYSVRDFLTDSPEQYGKELVKAHERLEELKTKSYTQIGQEFIQATPLEQIEILTLLLIDDESTVGWLLYETLLSTSPDYREMLRQSLHYSVQNELDLKLHNVEEERKKLKKGGVKKISLKKQIEISAMPYQAKLKALEKLRDVKSEGSDSNKARKWLEGVLKVPFGKYVKESVSKSDGPQAIAQHLMDVRQGLDERVCFLDEPKEALMKIIAKSIQKGSSGGEVIALYGPPGTGKTRFAKEAVAKALGRPFVFMTLGGASDASSIIGHNYTYVGAHWGRIVDLLIEAKCMNPVIYIDEFDKISQTEKGQEIQKVFTHLLDPSQNKEFHDKYFSGVDFDFSQCLFITSLNDMSKVDRITADRMTKIKIGAYQTDEKVVIAEKSLFNEVMEAAGFEKGDVSISQEMIRYIIDGYTMEAGVRSLQRALSKIAGALNLERMEHPEAFTLPIKIDQEMVHKYLKEPMLDVNQIASKPQVGVVNGLSVNSWSKIGKLQMVQVIKTPATQFLSLEVSGLPMETMKESMQYAKNLAWTLLPESKKKELKEGESFGLHIHAPEASVKKDGPSAGAAFTTAVISELTGIPVNNEVAMTGEIDIRGNIGAIGGVGAKIDGAKRAGATKVLIPKSNVSDLKEALEKNPALTDGVEVIAVEHIKEVLEHALLEQLDWNFSA